jgi:hypothetical protein
LIARPVTRTADTYFVTDTNITNDPGDDQITLAQQAYQAYGQTTGFKNYQGLPMPAWSALGDTIQGAWVAAVNAVVTYLQGGPPAADD